ncbi:MAG: hypothetical protein QME68_05715 [Elusimicrobiota bacterium]|nr:hypothetical protein [Elusimicrobiota bacterium]
MVENELYPLVVFDDSSKGRMLKALALRKNERSELVDEENKVLTNQDFETIKINEFGGILRGSKIPIKKDKSELVKYFISKK